MSHHIYLNKAMQDCVEDCTDCHRICQQAFHYGLEEGGRLGAPEHLRTLGDCSQICELASDFLLRASESYAVICEACAKVCARCAELCERTAEETLMRECAEICRRCAESCYSMAGIPA